MSYENAPATKIVATQCAVCARPLLDAKSVELGIGPDCRAKHGFDAAMPEEARQEANQIVYRIAARQNGIEVARECERLRALGFDRLATRILERVASVHIVEAVADSDHNASIKRGSTYLRSVPGNTRPASAAEWSSEQEARAELPALLGWDIEVVAVERAR